MQNVKISAIIPLYNKKDTIKRAINSVILQTYPVHEIIIINDGSTDSSLHEIQSIQDARIRVVNQINSGESAARNTGIEVAEGAYLAFLDADDEWLARHIEETVQLINNYPDAGIYSTSYIIVEYNGTFHQPDYHYIPYSPWSGYIPNYFHSLVAGGDILVCSSTVCIPKYVFNALGGFKVGKKLGPDVDMWGRIAFDYPVAFTWTIGAIYYKFKPGKYCSNTYFLEEEPFVTTIKTYLERDSANSEFIPHLNRYIDRKNVEMGFRNLTVGNKTNALKYFLTVRDYHLIFDLWRGLFMTLMPGFILKPLRNVKKKW